MATSRLLLFIIRFYKRYISPALPQSCRFYPTCSQYAAEAITRYGALKGGLMGLWRILRCNPFCKGGYDPVIKDEAFSDCERQPNNAPDTQSAQEDQKTKQK